jgi:hypothetical protein
VVDGALEGAHPDASRWNLVGREMFSGVTDGSQIPLGF